MPFTYASTGRGAFPRTGRGGTLSPDGTKPGRYYAAPAKGMDMPGRAIQPGGKLATNGSIDDYAVFMGVLAIQVAVGCRAQDGLYGPATARDVTAFQSGAGEAADGVVGPATARALFRPLITKLTSNQTAVTICTGIVGWESGWDPGTVGQTTPMDLGICQFNGPAWPQMNEAYRLTPTRVIPVMVNEITARLTTFHGSEVDTIASWNLGIGGATQWAAAGHPHQWKNRDPWLYVSNVMDLSQ